MKRSAHRIFGIPLPFRCIAAWWGTVVMLGAVEPAQQTSYYRDIQPVFEKSCTGCHHPGKRKGGLDLTTFEALAKGGENGAVSYPGQPERSSLLEQVSGDKPAMPKKGDPLSTVEVERIRRWISEGAVDDTPEAARHFQPGPPDVYEFKPVIQAQAYSPNGRFLAVAGYYEILLHDLEGGGPMQRLVGGSPRIEKLEFSPNGTWLAACGGAPTQYGELQIWSLPEASLHHTIRIGDDSLFGLAFSPDNNRVAVGGTDRKIHVIEVETGGELRSFGNHIDWIFAVSFYREGGSILSAGNDETIKLTDAETGRYIDDVNQSVGKIRALLIHPNKDLVLLGDDTGLLRSYKIGPRVFAADDVNRNRDVNRVKEFERQPKAVTVLACNTNGTQFAAGTIAGEARVYDEEGHRLALINPKSGPVFSVAFRPGHDEISVGGFDGVLRVYHPKTGELIREWVPFPIAITTLQDRPLTLP